jgi:hypothetical protein
MPEIYPKMTARKLKSSARNTSEGKAQKPLSGATTDAKHVNAANICGYEASRELGPAGRSGDAHREEERRGRGAFRATMAALRRQEATFPEEQGRGRGCSA